MNQTTGSFNSINPSSTNFTLSIKNLVLITVLGGVGIILLGVLSTWGVTKLIYTIKLRNYNSKVGAEKGDDEDDYDTARSKGKSSPNEEGTGEDET